MVCKANVSYRSVPKLFKAINESLGLDLKEPTHATVLIWMKKQGIANFKEKQFFEGKKWFLIIDESIQFGNKKLLAVVAVLSSVIRNKALTYNDLTPLVFLSNALICFARSAVSTFMMSVSINSKLKLFFRPG